MTTKDVMSIVQDTFSEHVDACGADGTCWLCGYDDFMKDCSSRIETLLQEENELIQSIRYDIRKNKPVWPQGK